MDDKTQIYRWRGGDSPIIPGRAPARVCGSDGLIWIGADESPFGVAGVDTRPQCQGSLSATNDESIVQRFAELRESDGSYLANCLPMPDRGSVGLVYNDVSLKEGACFRASFMEDRFDATRLGDKLVISNSWTGDPQFVVELGSGEALELGVVHGKLSENLAEDPPLRQLIDYLIKAYVFDLWAAHPLPRKVGHDPSLAGTWSWLNFGRRAYFGTQEDTCDLPVLPDEV